MKKLYELDASKEFQDESAPTESGDISEGGVIAGDFEAVSGMGIGEALEDDETVENNLQEMLAAINAKTGQDAEDFARQEAERKAYLEEEERKVEEARSRFNRERYEREQAALAERNRREEEERLEAERLEAERKEKSFFNKLKKKIAKVKEVEEEDEPEIEASSESAPEKEEPLHAEEVAKTPSDEFMESFDDMDLSGFIELEDKEEEKEEPVVAAKEDKVLSEEVEEEEDEEERKGILSTLLGGRTKATRPERGPKPPKKQPKQEKVADGEPDWKFIATHDELTELLNARAYKEDIARQTRRVGIIFFDVNDLKGLNENFGRTGGDRVVLNIANILKDVYGEKNLYRIGGDEFVLIVPSPGRNWIDTCIKNSGKVHNACADATKNDPEKALHAVAIGYAQGDGEASVEDVVKVADYAMFQNKKAYKLAHQRDAAPAEKGTKPKSGGGAGGAGAKEDAPATPEDYDSLLPKEQRELKEKIKERHEKVSRSFTSQVMREIQKKASEIEAILIASPDFNHLFVITDIDDFLDMMEENKSLIDYSYFYVVYQEGTQYYGADEYYDKVTDLFRNVAEALLSGKFRSEKDIQSIPGINTFKNVYV